MGCGESSRWRSCSELRARARNRRHPQPPCQPAERSTCRTESASNGATVGRSPHRDTKTEGYCRKRRRDFACRPENHWSASRWRKACGRSIARDYADLRATATPVDGGVRIDFVVREQLFFNQVIIRAWCRRRPRLRRLRRCNSPGAAVPSGRGG